MNKALRVSPTLALPIDFVTKTCAILAQRRKGKTYTASVIAEELVAAKLPFVALDPTGAWWGLRSSANGQRAGLPVVVIGGQHGDLPLERAAGGFVADLVLDHPGYYVLDLSLLESRGAEREFATAFGERLHRRKQQPRMDFPLHLFVDEADLFVPQDRETGDMRMLGAYQGIVRRGGLHGLGSTLISQRPALVNKSVLSQLDILILLRLVAGQDQDAVEKNYVRRAGSKEQAAELMGSLASLAVGEAWVWEPGAEPPLFERVRIRERRTFNSSATPKPGEKRVEPKVLAKVDLEQLRDQMDETLERAKENDPAELRKRIRTLEAKLTSVEVRAPQTVEVEKLVETLVEVQVLDEKHVTALRDAVQSVRVCEASLQEKAARLGDVAETIAAKLDTAAASSERASRGGGDKRHGPLPAARVAPAPPRPPARPAPAAALPRVVDGDLPYGAARLLTVLAQFPAGRTRKQLGVLAGYKASGSTFRGAIAELRRRGYVSPAGADPIVATPEGLAAAPTEPLPTGRALYDHWMGQLPEGARKLLEMLYEAWPNGIGRDELAERAGYEPKGSTFRGAIAELRRRDLATPGGVEPIKAADELMETPADEEAAA